MAAISFERLAELGDLGRFAETPFTVQLAAFELAELVRAYREMCAADDEAESDDEAVTRGPSCPALFEGFQCAYEAGHENCPHWTITNNGEFTWTEESEAILVLARQMRRCADGLEALAEKTAQ